MVYAILSCIESVFMIYTLHMVYTLQIFYEWYMLHGKFSIHDIAYTWFIPIHGINLTHCI